MYFKIMLSCFILTFCNEVMILGPVTPKSAAGEINVVPQLQSRTSVQDQVQESKEKISGFLKQKHLLEKYISYCQLCLNTQFWCQKLHLTGVYIFKFCNDFVVLGAYRGSTEITWKVPVSFSGLHFWPPLKIFVFVATKLKSGYRK